MNRSTVRDARRTTRRICAPWLCPDTAIHHHHRKEISMMTAYEGTLADRWDGDVSEDPDDAPESREMSAQRRARALMDAP
jgi:hypothetical protein